MSYLQRNGGAYLHSVHITQNIIRIDDLVFRPISKTHIPMGTIYLTLDP
jgi:hypothetical protein